MLTIDEAIEILKRDIVHPGTDEIMHRNEAKKLAIEALRQLKNKRPEGYIPSWVLLPGETKEQMLYLESQLKEQVKDVLLKHRAGIKPVANFEDVIIAVRLI